MTNETNEQPQQQEQEQKKERRTPEFLRKQSVAVFLACEESIAEDISISLRQAADDAEALVKVKAERDDWHKVADARSAELIRLRQELENLRDDI